MLRSKCIVILCWALVLMLAPYSYADEEPAVEMTVRDTDTLIGIGKEYLENPHRWTDIARMNDIANPDLIYPGQVLRIPLSLLKGEPVFGVVSFLKGRVEVREKGSEEWRLLSFNERVGEGMRIKTDSEGAVEIVFKEGNSLLQSSNTVLDIHTARNKADNYGLYRLFLNIGRTVTKIRSATGKESRFEIDTPSCVAAARGTVFRTSCDHDASTRSEVLQGVVDVEGMHKKVQVEEGEGTLVRKGEPPMEPRKLLPPPVITNLQPAYKAVPISFKFGRIAAAVSYRVIFSRDDGFRDVLKEQVVPVDEHFKIFEVDDGTYFLQTRSIDALGLEGLPSETSVVSVRANPAAPIIESPVNGTAYRRTSLRFAWLNVPDAVRYRVQVARDGEFRTVIEDRSDIRETTCEPGHLVEGTYYFRISAVAEDGYQGEWSDSMSFSVTSDTTEPLSIE